MFKTIARNNKDMENELGLHINVSVRQTKQKQLGENKVMPGGVFSPWEGIHSHVFFFFSDHDGVASVH